ncbi:MAG TPA: ribulose-phosphate 3-epimerase [Anaerolineales bacterium]|nr:ribulose-phosphate 3-epimerase [Anaerolineales bacterium]|tara:strand:- start:408 stop:1082 length:675 start_codon:yes stop_codon:yes gene_type:complete
MAKVKLAPSILSADFACLGEQVELCLEEGCEFVHVDVMDGHFVPNISMGPMVVKSLKPLLAKYNAVMDVHLMITKPDNYLKEFAEAGADVITVHVESCGRLGDTVEMIRSHGVRPGITLNPDTKLEKILEVIPNVDLVLIMSVNPGFGGQKFVPATMKKIADVRKILDETESKAELEVDGGIKVSNVRSVVEAGASVVVAGSAIFSSGTTIEHNIAEIRKAVDI